MEVQVRVAATSHLEAAQLACAAQLDQTRDGVIYSVRNLKTLQTRLIDLSKS